MAIKDVHNNITVARTISPVAIGTTGTGQTGKPIDTLGYQGVELIFNYGSVTATNAVFTTTVKEGDVTGTMTSVADADLLGTELLAGVAAQATARTSGVGKNVSKKIGYIGSKRYVSGSVKSTVTAGTLVSADVVLARPLNAPTP